MSGTVDTRIDPEKCVGCGLCVPVCPRDTISMQGDVAVVTGDVSIGCGHCAAACPEGAITVGYNDPDACKLATVEGEQAYIQPGDFDVLSLVRLMRSRRSCRNYLEKPVPREILEDLVRIGITAPSGTNTQSWTFTLVPDRESVVRLGAAVAEFFRKLNRTAESGAMRLLAKVFMKDALGAYYRDHYPTVKQRLKQWDEDGRDSLFHGAPALILIGSMPSGSTPAEDALLASQNILLAAHAMGLGTCLIGFAVEAIKREAAVRQVLKLPRGERIYSVITVGYPNEEFSEPAGRRKVVPRIFTG